MAGRPDPRSDKECHSDDKCHRMRKEADRNCTTCAQTDTRLASAKLLNDKFSHTLLTIFVKRSNKRFIFNGLSVFSVLRQRREPDRELTRD